MRNDRFSLETAGVDATVSDADLIGFYHPREIVHDPLLTLARKRQLVSYWLSDIHAVAGCPALRSYQFGPSVTVDDLFAALTELDEMVDWGAIRRTTNEGVAA